MATQTHMQRPVTSEQYTTLWTIMAVLAIAVPALAGYVSYSHSDMRSQGIGVDIVQNN